MKLKIALAGILISIFVSGCMDSIPNAVNGDYCGKVIDADTGKPLEGVVAMGEWDKIHPGPAGAVDTFSDARETVTDKNGEFCIPGAGEGGILSEMSAAIFKAGYGVDASVFKPGYKFYIDGDLWSSLMGEDIVLKKIIRVKNGQPIIPLTKFTMKERKELYGWEPSCPFPTAKACREKLPLLMIELNKNSIEIGHGPLPQDLIPRRNHE